MKPARLLPSGVMDITERKKAELELRESEERLHAIFDASMAGIIMVNPEGLIVFANQRMADMFNLPMNELVDSAYLGHLHPDEKSDGNHKMKKLIDGEVDSVSHERHYVRSDGSDFWGFLSGRRMVDEEGNVISIVGIISDITERKQAEVGYAAQQRAFSSARRLPGLPRPVTLMR